MKIERRMVGQNGVEKELAQKIEERNEIREKPKVNI